MSGAGGGAIILAAQTRIAFVGEKVLSIHNGSGSGLTLSGEDLASLAATYCPDPNTWVALDWNGTSWSVSGGPE